MAYGRSGWTTVAVSKEQADAVREKFPNINLSSFTRQAIEEKLEKVDLQKESIAVQRQSPSKAKKVATLKAPGAQKRSSE